MAITINSNVCVLRIIVEINAVNCDNNESTTWTVLHLSKMDKLCNKTTVPTETQVREKRPSYSAQKTNHDL